LETSRDLFYFVIPACAGMTTTTEVIPSSLRSAERCFDAMNMLGRPH